MQPQLMMKNNDSRGMKVLLLLLVLILATIASFAQGGYTRPNTNYGTRMYRLGVDSAMSIPTGCDTPTSLKSTDLKQAMLFYDSCNAAMFVRNPKTNTWVELAAGGSVVYVDSIYTMPDSAKLFYTKNSNVYSIDLVAALSGGDSSIFEQIIDTTNIESFAIPYADTSGRFKADSGLRFQPSTKTVITNNLYLYGTTASQPGKLWLKQANPSGGQRPVIYSGLIPEEFGNGAIHFSGGGGNAVMEINSGDNNDLLLHSPDGSLLFKQTDGLYRYYYLPSNTSTRKVLVTDDSGYVAWNVIDSLVSSLAAGNGIDITNGIVKLDDTLRTDTRFIAHADSGITNLELMGIGTGGLSAQGLKIYPHLGLLHLYAYEPGAGGSLFMYGNGEVTLIGKPLHLNADSIYLDKPGGGPYGPTATDMSKYKVVLMDSTTGAMTTAPLDSLGGGGGTPAGSNGQVQFNNSGSFGASSNFNWDNTNNRLGILTASPLRPLHVAGTTQGVLLPRLTTAQKNAISTPQDGEIVYDTDQRNLSTYSGSTSTWIPARSLVGYNSSTASLFVTDGIGVVTGVNANNTILQYRTADFPGTGHVIIGRSAAAAVSGTPTGLTIIGNDAGYNNSSNYSTIVGQSSGSATTTGTGSTIVGAYAYSQGATITGAGNSIFGAFNHRYGVAGAYNSSFGYQTNWFGGGNYNITLGAFVDQQSTTATGYLNIGNVIYGLGLHQSASNSSTPTTGGQIGIGVAQSSISASARLQIDATDKGFLPPRMTTTQMSAISSPAAGLMIYNTTENATMTFDGTRWVGFRYNGTVYQGYNSTSNTWTNLN